MNDASIELGKAVVLQDQPRIYEALDELGGDPNQPVVGCRTPLMLAAALADEELLEILCPHASIHSLADAAAVVALKQKHWQLLVKLMIGAFNDQISIKNSILFRHALFPTLEIGVHASTPDMIKALRKSRFPLHFEHTSGRTLADAAAIANNRSRLDHRLPPFPEALKYESNVSRKDPDLLDFGRSLRKSISDGDSRLALQLIHAAHAQWGDVVVGQSFLNATIYGFIVDSFTYIFGYERDQVAEPAAHCCYDLLSSLPPLGFTVDGSGFGLPWKHLLSRNPRGFPDRDRNVINTALMNTLDIGPSAFTPTVYEPLGAAIAYDDTDLLMRMLKMGANPNRNDNPYETVYDRARPACREILLELRESNDPLRHFGESLEEI